MKERRSHTASLACDVFASHVGPLFLIFVCRFITGFQIHTSVKMTSSCRRPEHSAPPEVVSNLVYLKWRLLVNATVCAICFGGVKGSLKTFACSCRRCFYCQFNLIYSQHIPLKWQHYFILCHFIYATIFETSHTKSSQIVVYFESFFFLTFCRPQFYNEEEAKKYSQK